MIVYFEPLNQKIFAIAVILDGRRVGLIRSVTNDGRAPFYYAPKSGGRGEEFMSIQAVKRSLEEL